MPAYSSALGGAHVLELDATRSRVTLMLERLMSWEVFVPPPEGAGGEEEEAIVMHQRAVFERCGTFTFVGDLIAARNHGDDRLILLDGRRRFAAMRRLYALKPDYLVCVTVLRVWGAAGFEEACGLVGGRAPHAAAAAHEHRRCAFEELGRRFVAAFRPFVSDACRPKAPNMTVAALLEAAALGGLYEAFGDADAMFACVRYANCRSGGPPSPESVEKANAAGNAGGPLCLATAAGALSDLLASSAAAFARVTAEKGRDAPGKRRLASSSKLPATVRTALWTRHFGADSPSGECACCRRRVAWDAFECGHVVSRANGGSDALSNLQPLCAPCNRSMGRENMTDFTARLFPAAEKGDAKVAEAI
jgi:hypothetical protein